MECLYSCIFSSLIYTSLVFKPYTIYPAAWHLFFLVLYMFFVFWNHVVKNKDAFEKGKLQCITIKNFIIQQVTIEKRKTVIFGIFYIIYTQFCISHDYSDCFISFISIGFPNQLNNVNVLYYCRCGISHVINRTLFDLEFL